MSKANWGFLGLLVSATLSASSAIAQSAMPAPSPNAVASEKTTIAQQFATYYIPEALVRSGGAREFEKNARAALAGAPESQAVEKQFPGTIDAAITGGRAEMMKLYDDYLPKARAAVADVAITQFSIDDMRAINRFYASPTGQKVIRLLVDGVDTSALVAEARADPKNFQMKPGDVEKMIDVGKLNALSAAEKAEMSAFNYSPAGLHFAAARPELEGKMLAIQNATFSSGMPRIQQALQAAAQAHVAGLKAKAGTTK